MVRRAQLHVRMSLTHIVCRSYHVVYRALYDPQARSAADCGGWLRGKACETESRVPLRCTWHHQPVARG